MLGEGAFLTAGEFLAEPPAAAEADEDAMEPAAAPPLQKRRKTLLASEDEPIKENQHFHVALRTPTMANPAALIRGLRGEGLFTHVTLHREFHSAVRYVAISKKEGGEVGGAS